ncbi:MAG TPA: RNA methyltransferase substrate-binding domain-containing protein, partial [Solirubrobacteraceae bacterium]|nr:RNA methyltransferase substrate-binding domain-containing protein [Solirubrobacteraceae bacterium]
MPKQRGKRDPERPRERPERGRSRQLPDDGGMLYGRNPVREALLAGRRRVHRVWATAGAAREPWLADAEIARPEEIARRC